jgi:pyrroline-5-carboxylate reductase
MSKQLIAFIGGGNMAASLVGGLIADGVEPDTVWVTDTDAGKLAALQQRFGVRTSGDNRAAVRRVDTVVLAVKPQSMAEVCREIGPAAAERTPLVVSIAAGVRASNLAGWLGYPGAAVVRCMPNTPALVGSGATALFANEAVTAEQRSRAENILRAVGLTLWVDDEAQIDAVTALSGSGPAYFFLLMELLEKAGRELGLPGDTARLLTLQTAFGAAKMALESDEAPGVLRQRVTSPGGTTEAALDTFRDGDLEALVRRALTAARDRGVTLGELLGTA